MCNGNTPPCSAVPQSEPLTPPFASLKAAPSGTDACGSGRAATVHVRVHTASMRAAGSLPGQCLLLPERAMGGPGESRMGTRVGGRWMHLPQPAAGPPG